MSKFCKFFAKSGLGCVVIACLSLTACATNTTPNRTVTGIEVGTVAVFTDGSLKNDVTLAIDGRFFAALDRNSRVEQRICSGNHTLQAVVADDYQVKIKNNQKIIVETAKVNYIKVSQNTQGLVLTSATSAEFNRVPNVKNSKLVSRLTNDLIKCK